MEVKTVINCDDDDVSFKLKDMSKVEAGRKQIDHAEIELPGLIACRKEWGESKPLSGTRITVTGSLHTAAQTAVLVETLTALGAKVQ